MTRYEDWPARLVGVIDAAAGKPFAWGEHDCCLFACDCIKAMTGEDPAAPFRGKYRSRGEAVRALRDYAGTLEDVARQIAEEYDAPPITEGRAFRGDLALVETVLGDALAIHYGGALFTTAADGLARLPIFHARLHWAV